MALLNLEQNTILVVEDDDMSYLYLNQLFKVTRCVLLHAESGMEALEIFRKNHVDLILMDIHLPDMDGTRITREIRMTDKKIPIIAQTAGKSYDEKERALDAGCNEVLIKPFTMDELFGAIKRQLSASDQ
jgi:CheY-like chemotaxis protein